MSRDQDGLIFFTGPDTGSSIVSTGNIHLLGGRSSMISARLNRAHERNRNSRGTGTSSLSLTSRGPDSNLRVQDAEAIVNDSTDEQFSICDWDYVNTVVPYLKLDT